MRGGYFGYSQYSLGDIADTIEKLVENNHSKESDEYGERVGREYARETVAEFKAAVRLLRESEVVVNRIDWLLSGDDSEESFHKRLEQDLADFWNDE